jgi:hypothetical protein
MLKRHLSIGVSVVYIDIGSPVPNKKTFHQNHVVWQTKIKSFDGMEMNRNNRIVIDE